MRENEREATLDLLDSLTTMPLDSTTADLAGGLIREWRSQGVVLGDADAVIAASALMLGVGLVTTNPRHFPMPELVVWQADEDGKLNQRV